MSHFVLQNIISFLQ